MKRSALFACAAVILLGVPARQAFSSPFKQADAYYKVRDQALQLVTDFTTQEVQTQPQKYANKLLEVRGQVIAVVGSDRMTTLSISGGEGTAPLVISLPPDKKPADWPFLDVGTGIRALCRVVMLDGSSTGSLELVMPVKEYEAARVDQDRAQASAKKAQVAALKRRESNQPTRLASRGFGARTIRRGTHRSGRSAATAGGYGDYTGEQLIEIYANAVQYFNHRINPGTARSIAASIIKYSQTYGLDARLVMAVIACESNFNPHAVSPVGAMGLGQLMPGTASDLGVGNAYDVNQNLAGSVSLLKTHIRNFQPNGDPTDEAIKLALACYNAGAGAVRKYHGIPPYRETQNYVARITRLFHQMKGDWR